MNIIKVEDELTALKKQLVSHKVYEKINNVDSLKIFMDLSISYLKSIKL